MKDKAKVEEGKIIGGEALQLSRWAALKSWMQAGLNIGWDLGQGLTLFLPKGLLQPFKSIAPQKNRDIRTHRDRQKSWWDSLSIVDKFNHYSKHTIKGGFLTPAMYLAHYIVSPILGISIAILAMLPGMIGGLVFNQHIRNLEYHYAMDVVNKHSATAVWGAIGMSALLTYSWIGGGFCMPGFTLPSIWLVPALSVTPFLANWVVPMAAAYSLMILLSVGQSLERVYDISRLFAFHSKDKQSWTFSLKGTLNSKLKNEQIRARAKEICLHELDEMSKLYAQKADEYRQQFEKEPYQHELTQKGLLTQYGLIAEQSQLIDALAKATKLESKNDILDQRESSFTQRISDIKKRPYDD